MGQTIYQVDAFTAKPFAGNPAAVCILAGPAPEGWMQQVALEMNLAETAYLWPEDGGFRLRWFTPTVEVDLCGHATLASAHILWETGVLPVSTTARFYTRSGLLTATKLDDWIELDFPVEPAQPVEAPDALLQALHVAPAYVGKNRMDYLIEVESESAVMDIKPDANLLMTLGVRGVIVTARSDRSEYDFISRFFAPEAGVPEDPVTGSAHCCLAPYWQGRLNKNPLTGYQASSRGGVVKVEVRGERVLLRGQAVTVLRAELLC